MELKLQLENSLKDAMRTNNETAKRTVRMVLSAVKLSEIEKGIKLDDSGIVTIIHKEIKSRKEAISESEKANRLDLIEANQQEIKILETFLPPALSDKDLETMIHDAMIEAGASKISDMGKVMKIILPKVQGRASNDRISQAVKKALQ
jgi:hypothetical protein